MEENLRKPLYLADCNRGISFGASLPSPSKLFSDPSPQGNFKSCRAVGQLAGIGVPGGDHPRSTGRALPRVLLPCICRSKTVREISPDIKSQEVEQVFATKELPDGEYIHGAQASIKGCVLSHDRSKGCLPSYPDHQGTPVPAEIRSPYERRDSALAIPSSSLWISCKPKDLHKGPGGGCSLPTPTGGVPYTLPRRPFGIRAIPRAGGDRRRQSDFHSGVLGLDSKQREIFSGTVPNKSVPGISGGYRGSETVSSRGKTIKGGYSSILFKRNQGVLSQAYHEGPRSNDLVYSSGSLGSAPLQGAAVLPFVLLGQKERVIGCKGVYSNKSKDLPRLVAGSGQAQGGLTLGPVESHKNHYRCKRLGLGRSPGGHPGTGGLDAFSGRGILQPQRTLGGGPGVSILWRQDSGLRDPSPVRQCDNGLLPESSGGHQIQETTESSPEHLKLGRRESSVHIGGSHKRNRQCGGRLLKPATHPSRGMGVKSGGLSPDKSDVRDSGYRSFCPQREQKSGSFFLSQQRRGIPGSGRSVSGLGLPSSIRFSPTSLNTTGLTKIGPLRLRTDPYSPMVAKKDLVCHSEKVVNFSSAPSSNQTRSSPTGASPPPRPGIPQTDGMVLEEEILRGKGCSDRVIETLLGSRKLVTRRIYSKVWNCFSQWCRDKEVSYPSVPVVLEFLQAGVDQGISPNTLRVQIAALSVFLDQRLALEPLIKRFLLARERVTPVRMNVFPPWNLSLVLEALTKAPFEPAQEISVKFLTLKLAFLLAITTARRVSDLQALSVKEPFLLILEDRVVLRQDPLYLPKVASKFNRSQEITLPSFCDNPKNEKERKFNLLDVRKCLLTYLDRVKDYRKSNHLLVLFSGPRKGGQASKSTVARWIRQTITLAYEQTGSPVPGNLKAHSTRSLAASWAERAGASIEQVCRTATWAKQDTFLKHYRVELLSPQDLTFGRKVLQAVVPP